MFRLGSIGSLVLAFLFSEPWLGAQNLAKVNSETEFAESAVRLQFNGFQAGASIARAFTRWGVTFDDTISEVVAGYPTLPPSFCVGCPPRPQPACLLNKVRGTTEPGSPLPLIVDFAVPVKKVGFILLGSQTGSFTIKGFNGAGEVLGSFNEAQAASKFLGVSQNEGYGGISKVLIDSGGGADPVEVVESIVFEYAPNGHSFEYWLPHVGDGPVFLQGGVTGVQTEIVIVNPADRPIQVSGWFIDDRADSLAVRIGGKWETAVFKTIPARGSTVVITDGTTTPVASGYLKMSSNGPIDIMAIYRAKGSETVVTEVGMPPAKALAKATAHVEISKASDLDSALAMVNTSSKTARVVLSLADSAGEGVSYRSLDLWPGEHYARFLWELFPFVTLTEFRGSVSISSDQPLSIEVVRTRLGMPVSSLPVASEEQ